MLRCTLVALVAAAVTANPLYTSNSDIDLDANASAKLLQVHVLWRHGARTPISLYPNSPNDASTWPQGFGQLTTTGMAQQFHLGSLLRDTYVTKGPAHDYHLNADYMSSQVHVRSDDVDRTLMSAYSNLAGMFPDGGNSQSPNSALPKLGWPGKWSPIPVHTVARNTDNLLSSDYPCPRVKQLQDELYSSPAAKKAAALFMPIIEDLNDLAGYNKTGEKLDLTNVYKLWDTAYIEKYWNMDDGVKVSAPAWFDKNMTYEFDDFPPGMNTTHNSNITHTMFEWLSIINFHIDSLYDDSKEIAKLRGGWLLQEIVNDMDMCAMGKCGPMYKAYSAHDVTVLALLRTFQDAEPVVKLTETGLPKYAAAVSVELWNVSMSEQVVRVMYHDGIFYENTTFEGMMEANSSMDWQIITDTISGCPANSSTCGLETFKKRSAYFTSVKKSDCTAMGMSSTTGMPHMTTTKGAGVASATLLSLFMAFMLLARL